MARSVATLPGIAGQAKVEKRASAPNTVVKFTVAKSTAGKSNAPAMSLFLEISH